MFVHLFSFQRSVARYYFSNNLIGSPRHVLWYNITEHYLMSMAFFNFFSPFFSVIFRSPFWGALLLLYACKYSVQELFYIFFKNTYICAYITCARALIYIKRIGPLFKTYPFEIFIYYLLYLAGSSIISRILLIVSCETLHLLIKYSSMPCLIVFVVPQPKPLLSVLVR